MFLDIIDPAQGRSVLGQWIARARFGLHIRLAAIATRINQALMSQNATAAARDISAYLLYAGFAAENETGVRQLAAYLMLADLNRIRHLLPFQKWEAPPEGRLPAYSYDGRIWAWWVHKIASRYGWSKDRIFDLWPEEAAAYLQEILVAETDEADQQRSLSELAYHYDKTSKTATFRPTPRPGWMVDQSGDKPRKIHKKLMPVGNIVKLEDLVH